MEDKELSHEESLRLINTMINKAKNSYHDKGIFPMLWGIVITICSLFTFLQVRGIITWDWDIWILTLFAIIPTIYFSIREGKKRKALYYEDRMMDWLWTCFGIGVGLLAFAQSLSSGMLNKAIELAGIDYQQFQYHPNNYGQAYFLLWYGFPTIVTGGGKRMWIMLFGGIFCWVSAIVSLYNPLDIDMLLMAASALLAWFIPGIILWNKYKRTRMANV